MELNLRAIASRIRQSETIELLDRVTAYRSGMEPAALDLILSELSRRGVSESQIQRHEAELLEQGLLIEDGIAWPCSKCERPAVARRWVWHRIAGLIPVVPVRLRVCVDHQPKSESEIT